MVCFIMCSGAGQGALIGMLLGSLMLSLLIEYTGIAFFWPEAGQPTARR